MKSAFFLVLFFISLTIKGQEICPDLTESQPTTVSKHHAKGINLGLRINNFVLYDVHFSEQTSHRALAYRSFFTKGHGIHICYFVKKRTYGYISNSKEHLILMTKSRGCITNELGIDQDMNGLVVLEGAKHFPASVALAAEILLFWTNVDNFIPE